MKHETIFDKPYDPKKVEEKIYKLWEKSGFFNSDKLPKTPALPAGRQRLKPKIYFTILLPPPNITGSLHLGHALNATISDILIRFNRMRGKKTIWLPGLDHAGIATQNVVEKELDREGGTRFDLGREKFIERVWQWKKQYGSIILGQFKKLGVSCDWSRLRFTLDKKYSDAVLKAFIHYYKKGWIYRGERVINWCPRCQTSLSDLEVEYKEEKTKLWYIKYPLKVQDSRSMIQDYIVVATTRPETMLGDAAVAVNPKDERYKNLIDKEVILPLQNREIPIIADKAVDEKFGTGAVKVTPAHDLTDAEIAERHSLPFYQVIDKDAKMTSEAGYLYFGLKTEECRSKVLEELEKLGLIEKVEDYTHNISLCYRCRSKLEPILSPQWFLKMDELKKLAIKAVKSSKVKIIPKNFEKIYFSWLNNVKDWCISRQIWWGHRLPVWFCQNQTGRIPNFQFPISKQIPNSKSQTSKPIENSSAEKFVVSIVQPRRCPFCKECKMIQSEDVLDTWFSSALWPFATLSKKDLKNFYPSDVLITARDIINLWVARMIFSGMGFRGEIPFLKVLIHATILTQEGKRMSKSKGTGVDPLELIDNFGADALRFGLIWQSMGNQDIRFDGTAVMAGRKFANKIWNASRFVINNTNLRMNTNNTNKIKPKTSAGKKILSQLQKTKKAVEKDIENFHFGQALHKIYDFFWHDFCDVYIEKSKKQLQASNPQTSKILFYVLLESLKILHPFTPFVTEAIYQKVKPKGSKKMLLIVKWQ